MYSDFLKRQSGDRPPYVRLSVATIPETSPSLLEGLAHLSQVFSDPDFIFSHVAPLGSEVPSVPCLQFDIGPTDLIPCPFRHERTFEGLNRQYEFRKEIR